MGHPLAIAKRKMQEFPSSLRYWRNVARDESPIPIPEPVQEQFTGKFARIEDELQNDGQEYSVWQIP